MTEHATDGGNALVDLDQFEKQVAELKRTYSTVPDVTTKEGYKQAKGALRDLTKMRTGTEKARLALTAPLRDRVKEINDLAKSLVGEVEKLEKPIRDAKQHVDDEIKRKNEARQAKIREGITRDITSYIDSAEGATDATEIREMIEMLKLVDVAIYGELEKEAEDERQRVIGILSTKALDLMTAGEPAPRFEHTENLEVITSEIPSAEPRQPASSGFDAPVATRAAAEPYDEALEDLTNLVDGDAEAILLAIMAGEIRHITFDS